MSTLGALTMQEASGEDRIAEHVIRSLPILVLFPHNRCDCRCMMCDIWRLRQVQEITPRDLDKHRDSLRALQVRWVVFSGGEALLHSDLATLSRFFRNEGIRVTLLTAGLSLARFAPMVAENIDDVIVSLDGPPAVHDAIRRVPGAYDRIADGVERLRDLRRQIRVGGRCTVQKANFRFLRQTVAAAHRLRLNSISFLAVDATSEAFNRPGGWTLQRQASLALSANEVEELAAEIDALLRECSEDIETGFIAESEHKLHRIVRHFRVQLGQLTPEAPPCNAPWVSAVVESDGTVRPCFFHRGLGNINSKPLLEVLNSPEAIGFRKRLDVANDSVCQRCVCSLHLAKSSDE